MRDALYHSIQQAVIEHQGFLSFAHFMTEALYKPGLGYYTSSYCPLGHKGDFITAPLMGNLFSRCLAYQCAQVLKQLGSGIILECGAGNGAMAAELLLTLEKMDCLPKQYWILELGAGLKAAQEHTLQERCPLLKERVVWLSTLPAEPFEGIIIGNEVLDALPLHLFEWNVNDTVLERGIGLNASGEFIWQVRQAAPELALAVKNLHAQYGPWPWGYQSEVSLMLKPWLTSLASILKRGVMLWIDYGGRGEELYHSSCKTGSLRCYEAHRLYDSPLENVGHRDITADVNFTAVGQMALELGLSCVGYIDQGLFLMNCHFEKVMEQALIESPELLLKIQSQARQLIHPAAGGMGARFKVMALTQEYEEPLLGFVRGNRVIYL